MNDISSKKTLNGSGVATDLAPLIRTAVSEYGFVHIFFFWGPATLININLTAILIVFLRCAICSSCGFPLTPC